MKIESSSEAQADSATYLVEELLKSQHVETLAAHVTQNWRHIAYPSLYFVLAYLYTYGFMRIVPTLKLVYRTKRTFTMHENKRVLGYWKCLASLQMLRVASMCAFAAVLVYTCVTPGMKAVDVRELLCNQFVAGFGLWHLVVIWWLQRVDQHRFPPTEAGVAVQMMIGTMPLGFVILLRALATQFADTTMLAVLVYTTVAALVALEALSGKLAHISASTLHASAGSIGQHDVGAQSADGGYDSDDFHSPRPMDAKKNK